MRVREREQDSPGYLDLALHLQTKLDLALCHIPRDLRGGVLSIMFKDLYT